MKKGLLAGVATISLAVAAYAAIGVYGAGIVTKRTRLYPQIEPSAIAPDWQPAVFVSRHDGLTLRGWWFPGKPGERALITVHGHGQNRFDKNWGNDVIAKEFIARGYSVLMFDLRGHGESAAARQTFGYRERNDVLGAFDYAQSRGVRPGQIAILGLSFGGAAMLMAAPEMPEAGALVSDSAYAAIWPVITAAIPKQGGFFGKFHPGPSILLAARLLYGIDLKATRPVDAVARVPQRRFLFIHGAEDSYVPPHNARQLLAASKNRASELWLVPGANHAAARATAPREYIERLAAFFDTELAPNPQGSRQPAGRGVTAG